MAQITIIHTNDLHNRLTPDMAERLRIAKQSAGPGTLLLDAGDAVGSGNATFRPDGEPVLDIMSEAGYDAMAVGNREFHFSQVGFRAKARRARFPLVSANLRSRVTGVTPPCSPFVWLDTPGMGRVAVFGLTVPMITERMTVRHISPFVFDDPVATCRAMSAQLRPNADLLICLSHCGLAVDRLLAEAASNVDVIVGGHTHAELPTGERIGQTLIVQAGSHARLYGIVRLEGSRDDWRTSCELAPL